MAQIVTINKLQTDGENKIANYLAEELPDDYYLYLQPNLQGNRPDIVVFHHLKGIFIIEIKDWKLERYYKKDFKLYKRENNSSIEVVFPSEQLRRYVSVFNDFISDLRVVGILNFPNASSQVVKDFIDDSFYAIGFDNKADILDIIRNTNANLVAYTEKIQTFINPPRHKSIFGEKILFTPQQKSIIAHKERSWKRIRGVAGSGKTLIIAQKAAQIASENKKVLIITFNKTLVTYIKDNIKKVVIEFDWNNIEVIHFHGFAKALLE